MNMEIIRTARYYNANGFAVAIVAVINEGIDWAAYIGGTNETKHQEDAVKIVSEKGCKLYSKDAKYYFPNIKLPYRE